jgi:uncharacterized membrane protein
VLYGVSLLMPAIAFTILVRAIIAEQLRHSAGAHSKLREAFGSDSKGNISLALYAAGIVAAFFERHVAWALFATVAIIWLVPDRRVTKVIRD